MHKRQQKQQNVLVNKGCTGKCMILFFANQDYLAIENLKGYADDLGLDTEKFDECLDSGAMEEEVLADLVEGQSFGISGTPGFFINGKLISGAQPYEVFVQEIEAAIASGSEEETEEVEGEEIIAEETEKELSPTIVGSLYIQGQTEKVIVIENYAYVGGQGLKNY